MADLIIKPEATSGNKLILKDQAGGAVLTTADSGATLSNNTQDNITRLGTVASGNLSNTAIVYPAGHVIQVKNHIPSGLAAQTTSLNWPSTALGFDNAIQSSSDVLVYFFATIYKADSTTEAHADVFMNGGGLGSTTSGRGVHNGICYRTTQYQRATAAYGVLDTAPGSTTPTYNLWFTINSSLSLGISYPSFILMEIAG